MFGIESITLSTHSLRPSFLANLKEILRLSMIWLCLSYPKQLSLLISRVVINIFWVCAFENRKKKTTTNNRKKKPLSTEYFFLWFPVSLVKWSTRFLEVYLLLCMWRFHLNIENEWTALKIGVVEKTRGRLACNRGQKWCDLLHRGSIVMYLHLKSQWGVIKWLFW